MADMPDYSAGLFGQAGQANPQTGGLGNIVTTLNNMVRQQGVLIQTINDKWPDWVEVPAVHNSPGVAGQVAYDTGFFYVCISSNLWKRVALVTW